MPSGTSKYTGLSIYEALAERIRRSIREGAYRPGQLIGSEHELARQESISRMTVRRASELLVNEGLVERRPGKGLFVRDGHVSTRLVRFIAGNLHWDSTLQISRGAQTLARRKGIQVQLYDAHGDVETDLATLEELPEGQARGAIIVSLHNGAFNEAVYRLKSKGFPFVLVDEQLHDIEVPSVTADNRDGGYRAGQALLKLGHRRIAFIGDLTATTAQERLTGLHDAICDAGVPYDRSLVMDVVSEEDPLGDWSGRVDGCAREVMGRANRPTAIFCSCDAVARAAYRTLGQLGLRVPQDVSVIGFDDDPLAEWLTPALTTVRQPFMEMGRIAIELLCERMINSSAAVEHRVLPVQLVNRASVAPPAQSARAV